MRLLIINAVCGIRSTGRICTDIAKKYEEKGYEVKIAYGRESVPEEYKKYAVKIGNNADVCWHALMSKLFDQCGEWSKIATRAFLKWADEYNPDVLWLHNIHDYFINIDLLFKWIKSRQNMQVRWTQHDCWAFTGGCFHFTHRNCDKWKTGCQNCPKNRNFFSRLGIEPTKRSFQKKKELFCGIKNMVLVAPSCWMKEMAVESFFSQYEVEVIKNQIDTSVFKYTSSDFRKKFGIENKKIILGVASAWGRFKGLYDFYRLAEMISDEYCIVLVGLTKEQIKSVPQKIIAIERTNSIEDLAVIYSASDVFLNLTYADTYPTVNLEAQACGTPCITYRTGGSPESVPDENVVDVGNLDAVLKRIEELCT